MRFRSRGKCCLNQRNSRVAKLNDTIAIVLAAGRGIRMGRPKALMRINGQPWWLLQHHRLQEIGVFAHWVVSETVESEMREDSMAPTSRVIADSRAPMMASVLAGVRSLSKTPPDGVFILPIDTPAPNKKVWNDCYSDGFSINPQFHRPAAPVYDNRRGHPLYLSWGWVSARLLTSDLDLATARLDKMIDSSLYYCVQTDDPDVLTNLNNPDQLNNWLQRNRSNT